MRKSLKAILGLSLALCLSMAALVPASAWGEDTTTNKTGYNNYFWKNRFDTLRQGDSNAQVRLLQTALNQFSQTLPINGVFDSTTWNQLYLFRSRNGLGGDTVADAAVWNKLQQDQYFYIENREVTGITGQGDYKFKFCWIVTDGSYAPEPIYTGNKAFFMHRSDGTWCLNSRGTLGSSPEYVVK